MSFKLSPLPYSKDALGPHLSTETIDFHHSKHHQGYVTKLNELVKGTPFENSTLESVIKGASGAVYNNAAQVWNHTFYWDSLNPQGGGNPTGEIGAAIKKEWTSFDAFKTEFTKQAAELFGSGWCWLVQTQAGKLQILQSSNADCPIGKDQVKPLLTCDVWEHAYYIDYRNQRPKYLDAFWNLVNWEFANRNLR